MARLNMKLSRVKSLYESEGQALASICKNQNIDASKLTAAHSEKMFIWQLQEDLAASNQASKENTCVVQKTETLTMQEAKIIAMQHFETFEGNIKILDQNDDHIVFARVR